MYNKKQMQKPDKFISYLIWKYIWKFSFCNSKGSWEGIPVQQSRKLEIGIMFAGQAKFLGFKAIRETLRRHH